jgi:hypothetical protein
MPGIKPDYCFFINQLPLGPINTLKYFRILFRFRGASRLYSVANIALSHDSALCNISLSHDSVLCNIALSNDSALCNIALSHFEHQSLGSSIGAMQQFAESRLGAMQHCAKS